MGDRAEMMEELSAARDQAAEEVVAVTEALASARAEARRAAWIAALSSHAECLRFQGDFCVSLVRS